MTTASLIRPALNAYQGHITEPERWNGFHARHGDVIIATPAKSGTTWTQSIVAMLLNDGPDLPDSVTTLSPWFDANFFEAEAIQKSVEAQTGRRVVKTHTPVDGFPMWDGVKVITAFRHPMEVMISLRKHMENMNLDIVGGDHDILKPLDEALDFFLTTNFNWEDTNGTHFDFIRRHLDQAINSDWAENIKILHYSQMLRDHAGTVSQLNTYLETECSDQTLAAITQATAFGAMKSNPAQFMPEAGSGFFIDEVKFFASGKSGTWQKNFNEDQLAKIEKRLGEVFPHDAQRAWLETGIGSPA